MSKNVHNSCMDKQGPSAEVESIKSLFNHSEKNIILLFIVGSLSTKNDA